MHIRQALRRQARLASQGEARKPTWWSASNVILVMMAGVLTIIIALEILFG